MVNKKIIVLSIFISLSISIFPQLRLANIFGDGMVLQRNDSINIWGWSKSGDKVSVFFQGDEYNTISNNDGKWLVQTKHYLAGGPFSLKITTQKEEIYLKDIYVGDVWLCSGQSNMHMKMKSVKENYPEEFNLKENKNIRFIEVPSQLNFNKSEQDIKNSIWSSLNSKSIFKFSAAAYFFAKDLQSKLNIPIGLILSAVGGSPVESWICEKSALNYKSVAKRLNEAKQEGFLENLHKKDKENRQNWFLEAEEKLLNNDVFYQPKSFDHTYKYKWFPFHKHTGVYWFKKDFYLDENSLSDTRLYLGKIGDSDSTFLNGKYIGNTLNRYVDREYWFSPKLLKKGNNTIEIKVYNFRWRAGFMFGDIMEFKSNQTNFRLMDEWYFADLCEMPPLKPGENKFWRPVGLFNGMIAPLSKLKLKGIIWYQGEANAKKDLAFAYRDRFSSLIKDWRSLFEKKDLPFLFVQLPNYLKSNPNPSKSSWATLRESQLMVSKEDNNGMIVSIDIGEANDIHPKNKKEIGERLAIEAMRLAYNDGTISKFDTYVEQILFEDRQVKVLFYDKKINFKGNGEHYNIAIAGKDKKFYWADVVLNEGILIAKSEKVNNPIAIRYAWSNNPGFPLLFNNYYLPISPFRSDNW